MRSSTLRSLTAEFVGTGFLLIAVVGSGIAAQRLSPTDVGLQLLENSLATAAALVWLIWLFGPASGAHFNPVVTLWARTEGQLSSGLAIGYVAVQTAGGITGVIVANLMFGLDAVSWSTATRPGSAVLFSEGVATFGLVFVVIGMVRSRQERLVAVAVAAYIGGAYFFTSSTSFANPAVTVARAFSDTFAGIAPSRVLPFVIAQLVGAVLAMALSRVTHPHR